MRLEIIKKEKIEGGVVRSEVGERKLDDVYVEERFGKIKLVSYRGQWYVKDKDGNWYVAEIRY